MSLVLKLFIDHVWVYGRSQHLTEEERDYEISRATTWASLVSLATLFMSILYALTDAWLIKDMKYGYLCKKLRDSMVMQIMWADDGRLSLMRAADYLNSGTNEVEQGVGCYVSMMLAVEKVSQLLFTIVMVACSFPRAIPLVLALIPVVVAVQVKRAPQLQALLKKRNQCERQYVTTLADIVENTQTVRSLPNFAMRLRQEFIMETKELSDAHLKAVQFNARTNQVAELGNKLIIVACLYASCFIVNSGSFETATPGTATIVIGLLFAATKDLTDLSVLALQMEFVTDGLRMVTRILNYPTDAHHMADEIDQRHEATDRCMMLHPHCEVQILESQFCSEFIQ